MDPEIQQVLAQLDSLRTTVTALAKKQTTPSSHSAPSLPTGTPPVPPSEIRRPIRRAPSLAEITSEDDAMNLRPTLYPHPPRPQMDSLEESQWDGLDALKLDTFQGFFNLSMLLLVFALTYIVVRNVKQHGVLFEVRDFTCLQVGAAP